LNEIHRLVEIIASRYRARSIQLARLRLVSLGVKLKAQPRPSSLRTASTLRVGYVPLLDCSPLIAAVELGICERNGLRVRRCVSPVGQTFVTM